MAQDRRGDALVYFCSAVDDLSGAVLHRHLDMEFADMKITKDFTRKDGVRTVTVQLAAGEKLMAFKEDNYYCLGGQLDDVVGGYCIIDSRRVVWCSIEQKWVDA